MVSKIFFHQNFVNLSVLNIFYRHDQVVHLLSSYTLLYVARKLGSLRLQLEVHKRGAIVDLLFVVHIS